VGALEQHLELPVPIRSLSIRHTDRRWGQQPVEDFAQQMEKWKHTVAVANINIESDVVEESIIFELKLNITLTPDTG
jgi:hypothetical protein